MFQEKINFKNSCGFTLSAIFEGETKVAPVVVMCHGYDSSKNSESNAKLAAELLKRGLSIFRFDFTGCGESEGELSDLIPSQGLDDLKSAVKAIGLKQFSLYGSSFGGHVSLMYASENPVSSLALKAPVSDYAFVVSEEISERRKLFIADTKNLNMFEKERNIKCPVLVVHGDSDDVVLIEQSKKLVQNLAGEKRLEILPGITHNIRGEALEKTIALIADFFAKQLL